MFRKPRSKPLLFSDFDAFVAWEEYENNPWIPDLPDEIWLNIFVFLGERDIGNVARTCKQFYAICNDAQVWRCATFEKFPDIAPYILRNMNHTPHIKQDPSFWKETYLRLYVHVIDCSSDRKLEKCYQHHVYHWNQRILWQQSTPAEYCSHLAKMRNVQSLETFLRGVLTLYSAKFEDPNAKGPRPLDSPALGDETVLLRAIPLLATLYVAKEKDHVEDLSLLKIILGFLMHKKGQPGCIYNEKNRNCCNEATEPCNVLTKWIKKDYHLLGAQQHPGCYCSHVVGWSVRSAAVQAVSTIAYSCNWKYSRIDHNYAPMIAKALHEMFFRDEHPLVSQNCFQELNSNFYPRYEDLYVDYMFRTLHIRLGLCFLLAMFFGVVMAVLPTPSPLANILYGAILTVANCLFVYSHDTNKLLSQWTDTFSKTFEFASFYFSTSVVAYLIVGYCISWIFSNFWLALILEQFWGLVLSQALYAARMKIRNNAYRYGRISMYASIPPFIEYSFRNKVLISFVVMQNAYIWMLATLAYHVFCTGEAWLRWQLTHTSNWMKHPKMILAWGVQTVVPFLVYCGVFQFVFQSLK